jgi:hypothetical protein
MASSSSCIVITALLLTAIFSIFFAATTTAYAQNATGMQQPTSGKSLDIRVDPTWSGNNQASFKVTFMKPGTNTVQQHIDYNFTIMKGSQKVFSAVPAGQPLLHTAEGIVTIPYTFQGGNGDYSIQVSIAGINFVPINTESATFPITVTPEFAIGAVSVAMASMIGAMVVLSRKFNIGLRI